MERVVAGVSPAMLLTDILTRMLTTRYAGVRGGTEIGDEEECLVVFVSAALPDTTKRLRKKRVGGGWDVEDVGCWRWTVRSSEAAPPTAEDPSSEGRESRVATVNQYLTTFAQRREERQGVSGCRYTATMRWGSLPPCAAGA